MFLRVHSWFPILIPVCALLAGCGCGKERAPALKPAAAPIASTIRLDDITPSSGIVFTHNNGAFGAKLLPETMGSGVAFIDYDGDGYQDLVAINSRDWTPEEIAAFKKGTGKSMAGSLPANPPRKGGTCRIYHNNGDGTFTDVTKGSGLEIPMAGMGATVGDYDNDGKPDLYITALGRNYLFHNETPSVQFPPGHVGGAGKLAATQPIFKDVSELAGVKDSGWSTSAAFVDYDKDGKLDLFVCHYVAWTPGGDIYASLDGKNKAYTTPEQYTGQVNRLYHNEGGGKFKDVSAAAGILNRAATPGSPAKVLQGKSLGICITDYDDDGWPDIVVANDTEPNYLFHNNGNGTFTETGIEAGIALSEGGLARASMGVDAADIDHSGRESLLFGNFSNQMLGLYQNRGGGLFIDIANLSEVGQASLQFLAFGAMFLDLDNDGWPDIITANGHLDEDIDHIQRDVKYRERPLLFRNMGKGRFQEVGAVAGPAMNTPIVGRGAAYADLDLDGYLDVVITTNGGPIMVLHNRTPHTNGALRIILQGSKSNRMGIGALIEAKIGADTQRRMLRSGSSYCSQSELPVTLGLGKADKIDLLTITWPSGTKQQLPNIPANQIVTIHEEKGIVDQKPFPKR